MSPDLVAERHQKITATRGPIIANRVMRAVRAVYRLAHKRRLERGAVPRTREVSRWAATFGRPGGQSPLRRGSETWRRTSC